MADKPKIGAGILGAYARMGVAEMRAALYPNSPIAQHTDYGMWGMATPSEAAAPRLGEDKDKDDKDSVLEDRLNQIGPPRDDPGREDRGMDRE